MRHLCEPRSCNPRNRFRARERQSNPHMLILAMQA